MPSICSCCFFHQDCPPSSRLQNQMPSQSAKACSSYVASREPSLTVPVWFNTQPVPSFSSCLLGGTRGSSRSSTGLFFILSPQRGMVPTSPVRSPHPYLRPLWPGGVGREPKPGQGQMLRALLPLSLAKPPSLNPLPPASLSHGYPFLEASLAPRNHLGSIFDTMSSRWFSWAVCLWVLTLV